MSQTASSTIQKQAMPVLVVSAMGVVFGDIGTRAPPPILRAVAANPA